jgi:hypothetical protein
MFERRLRHIVCVVNFRRIVWSGVVSLLATALLIILGSSHLAPPVLAAPNSSPDETWVTDGSVFSMAQVGNRVYLGGNFSQVGPNVGFGAALNATDGQRDTAFPKVNGRILAAVPDGSGGWYIGGDFTKVGSSFRLRLARVLSTGKVASWDPQVEPSQVNALALSADGKRLYVGGAFTSVGGTARNRLAAVDATTGAVDPNWNPNASGTVNALSVSGGKVYAGGAFTSVGGTTRNRLAAVDATTGTVDPNWNPNANGTVSVLTPSSDGSRVYAGGTFTGVGTASRNNVAAVDAATGAVDPNWNPNANGTVNSLSVSGSRVYAGGTFTSVGGTARNRLAAVDATTGVVDPNWNPNANFSVRALVPSADGKRIYLGGDFTDLSGTLRSRLAAVDATTGAVEKTFNAGTIDSTVRALAVAGNRLYVGGDFTSVKGQSRRRLASVDATTGALDSTWTPAADATVRVLRQSADGGRVYAGGAFTTISGQSRPYLAALNPLTGSPDGTWMPPKPNGPIFSLAESGGRVYAAAGGGGGAVEAYDSGTGTRAWSKIGDGDVQALLVRGDKVYAGGHFDKMDGLVRRRLVALDMATGAVDPQWVPEILPRSDGTGLPDSGVWTMAGVSGPRLFIGGDFQKISRLVQAGYAQFSDTDSSAPTVSATLPGDKSSGIALASNVDASFSEPMDEASLNGTTFTLTKQGASTPVAATLTYDPVSKKATLDPNSDLDTEATYTATLKGGTSGAKDVVGYPLGVDKAWSFSTLDTVAPETTIQSGPSGTAGSDSATFAFSSPEPGSSFECGLDGAPLGFYTSCTSPTTYTNLTDGAHTFQVRAIDAAGNVDTTPASLTWTVDVTAPTVSEVAPRDAAADVALDSGVEATFSEQMNPSTLSALTVTLSKKGADTRPVATTAAYDAATKKVLLTPEAALDPGSTYTATVEGGSSGAKDLAGNPLAADKVWSFSTVTPTDTTPPTPPTGLDLLASSDSGSSDSDDMTKDDIPAISGKAEAESFVKLYEGTNLAGSVTADASGDWTIIPSALGEGPHSLTATATDAAGNTSSASDALVVTIDKSAPTIRDAGPTALPDGDNGWYKSVVTNEFSASDNVNLADPSQALFQKSSGAAEGPTVKIDSGGVADVAGNTNPGIESAAFKIDMTAPVAPTKLDLLASSDTGTSDTDNVTADNTPTFGVDAEPGSTVRIYDDVDATPLGSAPADASGVATITSGQLADGTYTVSATTTDDAGNVSPSSTTIAVTIGVTVDTVAPRVSEVAPQDAATGVAPDAKVEATFSEEMDASTIDGATFTLTKDAGTPPIAAMVGYDAASGKATLDPGAQLDPGSTYTATIEGGASGVKDLAGNPLAAEEAWSFTTLAPADSTPPAVTIDSKPASLTNNASPTFSFSSSEAGSTFQCSLSRGTDPDSFAACDSPKGYDPLSDGTYTFKVKATDAAGNTSDPASYGFEVDATAPIASIDSGPSGTVGTDSATFTFSSESGATLECSLDGASFGSCTSPKNYAGLQDGSHTFGVRATDKVGNVSQTTSRSWTVDAASVIMAAGNIACNANTTRTDICRQMSTSDLLVNNAPEAVLPLGDDQYECGSLKDLNKYYGASWGRMKAITHPIPGNHEYSTSTNPTDLCYNAPAGAPGYFQYFGNAASPTEPGCTVSCKGYYSYDLGSWHIVALNSVCSQVGGCGRGSPQEVWLRNDLAAHPTQCTLAYWHYPRFSSSEAGSTYTTYLQTLWQDLYNAKVEVVLNAHDHIYERFAPMDTAGNRDRANGVRQFTVGTGGKRHMSIVNVHPNSEVRNTDTYGVLKMNLRPTGYDWNFMPIAGSTFTDSGSDSCH